MHVLVTGAGGFIGRSVVRKARLHGWKVTGVARRPGAETNLVADLRDPIRNWEVPDAVIHLAGGFAGCTMKELVDTDLVIANNLIEWGKKEGVRRWVFASAAEVYGDIDGEADEDYPCRPVIPYGEIKLRVEELFHDAGFPEVMVCRVGEVYGSDGRILHELGGKLRMGFCPWGGDGKVRISFIHVEDVAEALLLACEKAKPGFTIYNAGDNEPATWRQFLEEIASQLHVRGPYYLPRLAAYLYAWSAAWTDRLSRRPPNITPQTLRLLVTPKVLSSKRLHDELGFVPKYANIYTGLNEALHVMVESK
ncbi:MAG TPA: NAD(P)-dependent oxidoreductase [Candidatus Acidoferrales bacterium]|nr:NAD(P)-dependent oxidoreductase [Candidatus Acidoferrales bacterium]